MDIFEQVYKQLIMQDEVSQQTQQQRQELTYLKKVLNKYWDVDDDTILKIDQIINAVDQKNKTRFRPEKIDAINIIKKCYHKNMDVIEYLVDNNGKLLPQLADYVSKEGGDVTKRLQLPDEGYVSADNIINELKNRNINIDRETLSKICSIIVSKSGRGVGAGEVLCTTLLNVAQTNSGDGALNGKNIIQIKGYGARLKDADNYGQWNVVADKLEQFFKKKREIINNRIRNNNSMIDDENKKKREISEFPLKRKTCVSSRQIYNWIVSNKNQLNIKSEKEFKIIKDAFRHLFKNAGAFDQVQTQYNAFINSLFGHLQQSWEETFLTLCLRYYQVVGKWEYMIIIDNPYIGKGKETIFKGLYISNNISDIIDHIKVINWPSGKDERASAICIAYKEAGEAIDQASE